MYEFVSFNQKIFHSEGASISGVSSAALYGKGIFTTIAIYGGKPFLWEKHWRRLRDNAAKLHIDLSEFSEEKTRQALDEIIDNNGVTNGRVRITFFDESSSGIWHFESERKTSLLITTADARPSPERLTLTISSHRISSLSRLANVKSCNYLDNLMAFEDVYAKGFDEAVRLNERDETASACMANIFWLKDERLLTPSLKTGCLAGTTRALVLENIECEQVEDPYENLYVADAIFLTSAGLGVVQVNEFQGKTLQKVIHPIMSIVPKIGDQP